MAGGTVMGSETKEKNSEWDFWMNWVANCVKVGLLIAIVMWLSRISDRLYDIYLQMM